MCGHALRRSTPSAASTPSTGADLRGRMRWWGLYTQRKPGIDGGKTAILEPEELDDEYFMLRVRIDGGRLTTEQLRVIGEISQEFARGTADITDRQNVQYHWIRIEDVPEIWRRLEAVGPAHHRGLRRQPRASSSARPVAGIAADEIIDGTPAIDEIHRPLHRQPGVLQPAAQVQDRDLRLAAARRGARDQRRRLRRRRAPRARPRLRPVGRRRAVHQPAARRSGSAPGCRWTRSRRSGPASSRIFRDYGYRRLRTRARLKFLVADWGPEKFRQVLEDEYLKRPLARRPGARAARRSPARPRRRAPAEGRPLLRRLRPARRPGRRRRR